jgi:hypothetical protein
MTQRLSEINELILRPAMIMIDPLWMPITIAHAGKEEDKGKVRMKAPFNCGARACAGTFSFA